MKKLVANLSLISVMGISILSGCGETEPPVQTDNAATEVAIENNAEPEVEEVQEEEIPDDSATEESTVDENDKEHYYTKDVLIDALADDYVNYTVIQGADETDRNTKASAYDFVNGSVVASSIEVFRTYDTGDTNTGKLTFFFDTRGNLNEVHTYLDYNGDILYNNSNTNPPTKKEIGTDGSYGITYFNKTLKNLKSMLKINVKHIKYVESAKMNDTIYDLVYVLFDNKNDCIFYINQDTKKADHLIGAYLGSKETNQYIISRNKRVKATVEEISTETVGDAIETEDGIEGITEVLESTVASSEEEVTEVTEVTEESTTETSVEESAVEMSVEESTTETTEEGIEEEVQENEFEIPVAYNSIEELTLSDSEQKLYELLQSQVILSLSDFDVNKAITSDLLRELFDAAIAPSPEQDNKKGN
jgi:hypothetical protein